MATERRGKRESRDPDRRYGDRRVAKGFRTLVEDLVDKGEIEVVDSPWGREFKPANSANRRQSRRKETGPAAADPR